MCLFAGLVILCSYLTLLLLHCFGGTLCSDLTLLLFKCFGGSYTLVGSVKTQPGLSDFTLVS